MLNIAIVEDEMSAAEVLKTYLNRYTEENGEIFRITHYENGLNLLTNYSPRFDIIFMDIELPHMNGMECSRKIRELDQSVTIIFITNMAQYAVTGYEVHAFDFVVKPVSYYDFALKLTRALKKIRLSDEQAIAIPVEGGVQKLNVSQIQYVEIMKHQITFHTAHGDYLAYGTLKSLEEKLPKNKFVRCNNCFLVNLRYVDSIANYEVVVAGTSLQISHARKGEFMKAVASYLSKTI